MSSFKTDLIAVMIFLAKIPTPQETLSQLLKKLHSARFWVSDSTSARIEGRNRKPPPNRGGF